MYDLHLPNRGRGIIPHGRRAGRGTRHQGPRNHAGPIDGNLNRHLQVLERAKMVEIAKGHEKNRSLTICRITASGRKRYLEYLTTLEQVVRDAAEVTEGGAAPLLVPGMTPSRA